MLNFTLQTLKVQLHCESTIVMCLSKEGELVWVIHSNTICFYVYSVCSFIRWIVRVYKESDLFLYSNGDTMLHLVVKEGKNYFVNQLLNFIKNGSEIENMN